ncbi:acyl-CoA-binding protein homolog [Lutzomyia longipalpis]|uniref:acyl-CoA-binding protein homolog n=1 Tax=Lutzomyia longipalpis TaxID=7200 RepID=UPI002483F7B1|nr:acyl-CoA-binding protein homolog [Lutzomyia longipalpis]
MSLDEKFNEAAKTAREISDKVTKEEWMEVYALYKQATEGDNYRGRPSMGDIRGKALWQAWFNLIGMDQCEAKEKYITFVEQLCQVHRTNLN